jgi:phosphinothricin acetyltransferase
MEHSRPLNSKGRTISIDAGSDRDSQQIGEIFNHYVMNSIATFDSSPRTELAVRKWSNSFGTKGPYRLLVARSHDLVVGYCCSKKYRSHPAFINTVELSVYVAPRYLGLGVGSQLYTELFEILSGEAVHVAVAGVALPNPASIALHKKFRFGEVGVFHEYALKGDRYISSLWLERSGVGTIPLSGGTEKEPSTLL